MEYPYKKSLLAGLHLKNTDAYWLKEAFIKIPFCFMLTFAINKCAHMQIQDICFKDRFLFLGVP